MAVPPQPVLYPSSNDAATSAAIALLIHYFDLAPASAQLLVKKWLSGYPAIWVRAAVTEALYQGRYKPVSVDQILSFWQRRGRSIVHFNKEFETLIAVPLQGSFKTETDVAIEGNGARQTAAEPVAADLTLDAQDLSPEVAQGDRNWAAVPEMTLAEAFGESAGREQLAQDRLAAGQPTPDSDALPRPRLMLPGELPGKGLVQPTTDSIASVHQPSPQTQPGEDAALRRPDGFDDGASNPRPYPQFTQGPSPAMLPATKSKPIQPPPIGRFTPAADPSGFASRLKTVVQQAVAQTQAGEAQLSLETAIASQLASDPVLGEVSSGSSEDSAADVADALASPFADRFAMATPADSTSKAERGAFRDELDLQLDALALESNAVGPDANGLDSSGADGQQVSPQLDHTVELPPSRAVDIADVSNLMAGLTTSHRLGADDVALSLEDAGISDAKPVPEQDGKIGSD